MKKFIAGLVIGVGITSSFNVYAAVESLIGQEVQSEVAIKLNGMPLENKAAIVGGSSYLPVRTVGEALGLDVDFINNEVVLNKKKEVSEPLNKADDGPKTIEEYEGVIQFRKRQHEILDNQLLGLKTFNSNDSAKIKEFEDKVQAYKDETSKLEKEKAEFTK